MRDHRDREQKKNFRQMNMCQVHDTKLITTYYEDLDLLVMKCRDKDCTESHGMVESFQAKKDKKKQAWLKKAAQKIVDDIMDDSAPFPNEVEAITQQ